MTGEIFAEIKNRIQSGYNLHDVLDIIDGLRFGAQQENHELSHIHEAKTRTGDPDRGGWPSQRLRRDPRRDLPPGTLAGTRPRPADVGRCHVTSVHRHDRIQDPAPVLLARLHIRLRVPRCDLGPRLHRQLTAHTPPRSPIRGHSYVRYGKRFAGSSSESRPGPGIQSRPAVP